MVDAIKVGKFGFYKDPDLQYKLEDGNMFDQMTADGWIDLWFGGKILWLPDLGEFDIMAYCEQTFFWDLLDKDNKRNIQGFDEIYISRNEMIEPFYGDLVPLNPEEVFTISKPSQTKSTPQDMKAAKIWWYNHLFKDEYYRYSAIALPQTTATMNEIDAKILPINHNIILPSFHYIHGFRPKFEYYSKLAVMRKIVSGDKGKIHFRFKVDLDYLANNPDTKRTIKMFTQSNDPVKFLAYQDDPTKIIWENQRNEYKRMFLNYILERALVMYLPDDAAFEAIENKYKEIMWMSNLVLKMDGATYGLVKKDIIAHFSGAKRIYNGHTVVILDAFLEWLHYNEVTKDQTTPTQILNLTMQTKKYFKGFAYIADDLGLITIEAPYTGPNIIPTIPSQIKTIHIDKEGGREFTDGVRASKALNYIHNDDPYYQYTGETGSGYYWIRGSDSLERKVFCNMVEDMGGWMLMMIQQSTLGQYFYSIFNLSPAALEHFSYDIAKGTNFNGVSDEESMLDCPWVRFNEVKITLIMENVDTKIVLYNSLGVLVEYEKVGSQVMATYRDESFKTFAFGEIDDNFALPTEQSGLTIVWQKVDGSSAPQYIKRLFLR